MEKIIITISREYGCGAREVGERLAKKLGIPYYDRNIVKKTAEKLGFTAEFVESKEQQGASDSFWGMGSPYMGFMGGPTISDKIYLAQRDTILEIAKSSCVIVGRCADVILENDPACVHTFLHADMEKRIERVTTIYGVDPAEAEKKLKATDRARAKHHRFYCDKGWGDVGNYDLTVNMGKFEIDNAVELIITATQMKK